MNRLIWGALVVFLVCGSFGEQARAQPGELDQLMENAENMEPATGEIPDRDRINPSIEDADWFAKQAESADADEEQKKWADELRKVAASADKKIQAMKILIHKKFGVNIFEGDAAQLGEVLANEGRHWEKSPWTLEQLQTIYETLDVLPKKFRENTKRITKFKQEISETTDGNRRTAVPRKTFGRVVFGANDTVNLFDLIFTDPRYRVSAEKGQSKLKAVLVHEMTHCFQYTEVAAKIAAGQRGSLLQAWAYRFWKQATSYSEEKGFFLSDEHPERYITWQELSPDGFWENGITVSPYAGMDQRKTSGLGSAEIGAEDMAESTAFAFAAPGLMEERFEARNRFVLDNIFGEKSKGGGVPDIIFNPRWYGFSETMISRYSNSGEIYYDWADVGAGGSLPESHGKSFLFINKEDSVVHKLAVDGPITNDMSNLSRLRNASDL